MILTPNILGRLVGIGFLTVLLEVTFFSRLSLLGSRPAFAMLVVILLGLLGGVTIGAVSGFTIGFLIDCLIGSPLGSTALVMILIGYLAGAYRERSPGRRGRFALPFICMGLTLLAQVALLALLLLLGLSGPFSGKVVPDLIVTALYAFLLSVPLSAGFRRLLRPALIDDVDLQSNGPSAVLGMNR